MGKLRTIIVDDEPLAVKFLRAMLSDIEEIEIVEECCNGREAVKAVSYTHLTLPTKRIA